MTAGHGSAAAAAIANTFSAGPSIPRRPQISVPSVPPPFPSRLTKRRNHLRPKLLKTLRKPYPNLPSLQESHREGFIGPQRERLSEQHARDSEIDEFSLSQESSTVGLVGGTLGNLSTGTILKIGLYLLGAFVFQTVCAVMMFGFTDSENGKEGNLEGNGNGNLAESKQGREVAVDDSEMDRRILEIQEMAREARKEEKLKSKRNVSGEDDDDLVVKSAIEKEVDDRLMKLQKSLDNAHKRLPSTLLMSDGEFGDAVDKGSLSLEEAFGPLMFKKKYRFKSPPVESREKPKGFEGFRDHAVTEVASMEALSDGSTDDREVKFIGEDDERIDLSGGNVLENVSLPSGNDGTKEMSIKKDVDQLEEVKPVVAETESNAGIPQDKSHGNPVSRDSYAGKSSKLQVQRPRGFGKEDSATMSNKHNNLNKSGTSKGKKVSTRKSANRIVDKKSNSETDFWWSSLPFVMAILMQRGDDGEGPEGLFTLRSTSQTMDDSSLTVAFEDRGDATNFCYLVESFFEDLDDFSVNVVPIPVNELEEAVKSQEMKVLVVKKGQLQLYAGQPLTDVEMAMRALVGQSEVA